MLRLILIILTVPVFFSLPSTASSQDTDQELCVKSLVGTRLKTKRKFAKEVALRMFSSDAATVMRYLDSTEIITEVRSKKTREVVFVVAVRYRYQIDSLAPLEQSLYEVVIKADGRYSVKFLDLKRKPM